MKYSVDVVWTGHSYATIEVDATTKNKAYEEVDKMRSDLKLMSFDTAWEDCVRDETSYIEIGDVYLSEEE